MIFFLECIMRIRTLREIAYIYSSANFTFFKRVLFLKTAQGRITQGAPILAEIRASPKAVRQQNNDELEQRT